MFLELKNRERNFKIFWKNPEPTQCIPCMSRVAALAGVFGIVKLKWIQKLRTRSIGIRNRKNKWPRTLDKKYLQEPWFPVSHFPQFKNLGSAAEVIRWQCEKWEVLTHWTWHHGLLLMQEALRNSKNNPSDIHGRGRKRSQYLLNRIFCHGPVNSQ